MRAITYDEYGDTSVLKLTDQPVPRVGPDEVLVRVRSAAVNLVDWKVMEGPYACRDMVHDGTFAELACVPVRACSQASRAGLEPSGRSLRSAHGRPPRSTCCHGGAESPGPDRRAARGGARCGMPYTPVR